MTDPGVPAPDGRRDLALEHLEREVGVLLRRARRVLSERAALVHPDLHPAAYLMLALLVERGPLRPSEVVGFFELDKGAVSRQVKHLVALGLVRRDHDPADGRAMILSATEETVEGMARVVVHRRARLRERLGEWDDATLEELVGMLGRYNAALEQPEAVSPQPSE